MTSYSSSTSETIHTIDTDTVISYLNIVSNIKSSKLKIIVELGLLLFLIIYLFNFIITFNYLLFIFT